MDLIVAEYNLGDGRRKAADLDELADRGAQAVFVCEAGDQAAELRKFTAARPGWKLLRSTAKPGMGAVCWLVDTTVVEDPRLRMHLAVGARDLGPKGAGPDDSKPKYVAHLEATIAGQEAHLLGTHLIPSWTRSKDNLGTDEWEARRRHVRDHVAAIVDLARDLEGFRLLAGDLNGPPSHELLRPLRTAGFTGWHSYATHGTRPIDQVVHIAHPAVTRDGIGVWPRMTSDHRPVAATYTITPTPEAPVSSVLQRLRTAGFEVYSRSQWGSPREQDGSYARRAASSTYRLPKGLPFHFLHITVTADGDTVKEGKDGARQVESYGYTTPPMVSYQMLVTNEGRLFEGQNYGVKGTHTVNDKKVSGFPEDLNRAGYAVALMQNVDDEVTDIQVLAAAAAFAAAELEGWVRIGAPIHPHRKFAWKACPGDKAVARLNEIEHLKNQLVAAKLPAGTANLTTPLEDDMALSNEDLDKIAMCVWSKDIGGGDNRKPARLHLIQAANASLRNESARAEIAALKAAVDKGASKDDLKRMLENLDVTLQVIVSDDTPQEA